MVPAALPFTPTATIRATTAFGPTVPWKVGSAMLVMASESRSATGRPLSELGATVGGGATRMAVSIVITGLDGPGWADVPRQVGHDAE